MKNKSLLSRVLQVSLTSYRHAVNLFLNERNSIVIKIYQLVKMFKTFLCLHFFFNADCWLVSIILIKKIRKNSI